MARRSEDSLPFPLAPILDKRINGRSIVAVPVPVPVPVPTGTRDRATTAAHYRDNDSRRGRERLRA